MKSTIDGKTFVLTGKLETMTRSEAQRKIRAAGGKIGKSVNSKTDFVVVGKRPGKKYTQARSRGIPTVDEADLDALLSGEAIEVEDELEEAGERSMGEVIGEIRGVLDGHPSPEMWEAIVKQVDTCQPEQLEQLVAYVEDHVSRWDEGEMERQEAAAPSLRDRRTDSYDDRGWSWWYSRSRSLRGDIRVAPEEWITQMVNGIDSPKFRLIRTINLSSLRLTGTLAGKLFERPDLQHVRVLNLGENNDMSMTFFRKLVAAENMRSLEVLYLHRLKPKMTRGFEEQDEPTLENLRELHIWGDHWRLRPETMETIYPTPALRHVETFAIMGGDTRDYLEGLKRASALPSLRRLTTRAWWLESTLRTLNHEVVRDRVEALTLQVEARNFDEAQLRAIFDACAEADLETLEIEATLTAYGDESPHKFAEKISRALQASDALADIPHVEVGELANDEAFAFLRE